MTRRKMLLVTLYILLVLFQTRFGAAMELSQGFAGMPWGASITEQTGLVAVGQKGPVDFYVNPGVVHTIADIPVSDEVYGFFKGRFFAVYIDIEAIEVFGRLKGDLTRKYGEPKISMTMKSEQTIYQWKEGPVKIKLKTSRDADRMKLAFYHLPEARDLNETELEAHRETGLRFLPIEKDKRPQMMPLLEF